jgi:hypothetical protein
MLKRLSLKLLTLVMLCGALATVSSVPASSTKVFCMDAPIEMGCTSGTFCCVEYDQQCSCA